MWKATQKPSSIYTLCFLTEQSQAVTCATETTGILEKKKDLSILPILNNFLLSIATRKKVIQ